MPFETSLENTYLLDHMFFAKQVVVQNRVFFINKILSFRPIMGMTIRMMIIIIIIAIIVIRIACVEISEAAIVYPVSAMRDYHTVFVCNVMFTGSHFSRIIHIFFNMFMRCIDSSFVYHYIFIYLQSIDCRVFICLMCDTIEIHIPAYIVR